MASDGTLEEYSCRICLEPGERRDFIAPCACKGTSKWVHRSCLDQWRVAREDRAFSRCTECKKEYALISVAEDTPAHKRQKRCEFTYYVTRDIIVGLIGLHIVIFLFGATVWILDGKSAKLLTSCHMIKYPILFYYLAGILLLLAIAGLVFMIQLLTGGRCCGERDLCYDMYFISPIDNSTCCCCGCPSHPVICSDTGGFCCAECGAGCSDCGIASAGAEVGLVLFILLALIGLIVAVFAGIYFAQQIVQRHIHILQKRGLAKDFIVADLDSLSDDIETQRNYQGINLLSLNNEHDVFQHNDYDNHNDNNHHDNDSTVSAILQLPTRSQAIYRGHSRLNSDDCSRTSPTYELVDISEHSSSTSSITNTTTTTTTSATITSSTANNIPMHSNLTVAQQRQLSSLGLI